MVVTMATLVVNPQNNYSSQPKISGAQKIKIIIYFTFPMVVTMGVNYLGLLWAGAVGPEIIIYSNGRLNGENNYLII